MATSSLSPPAPSLDERQTATRAPPGPPTRVWLIDVAQALQERIMQLQSAHVKVEETKSIDPVLQSPDPGVTEVWVLAWPLLWQSWPLVRECLTRRPGRVELVAYGSRAIPLAQERTISAVANLRMVVRRERRAHRVVEAIMLALGVEQRIHARFPTQMNGVLHSPSAELSFHVENLSASGAKLRLSSPAPTEGTVIVATFQTPTGPVTLNAEVVRRYFDPAERVWYSGVHFVRMERPEVQSFLQSFASLAPSPPPSPAEGGYRRRPRYRLPTRLSVKARLERPGDGQRSYGTVVNVSESGILIQMARPMPRADSKGVLRARVLWSGQSFEATLQLVRSCAPSPGQERYEYAFRFVGLERRQRVGLLRLLAVGEVRQLRGQRSVGKAELSYS